MLWHDHDFMSPFFRRVLLTGSALILAASHSVGFAALVHGTVATEAGTPVGGVLMVLVPASGPATVSVTTDKAGTFRFPDLDLKKDLDLSVKGIGFTELSNKRRVQKTVDGYEVRVIAQPLSNVADQAPASAWLEKLPDDSGGHLVMLNCVNCHQLPNERVKSFASAMQGLPEDARRMAWMAAVKHMRIKTFTIAPEGHRKDIRTIPTALFEDDKYSGWTQRDGELMADALTVAMPTTFKHMPVGEVTGGSSPSSIGQAEVREYALPTGPSGGAMYHDSLAGRVGKVPLAWTVDWHNNKMFELNRETGKLREMMLGADQKGPHTIVPDQEGNLWVTFQISNTIGRWEPGVDRWTVFKLKGGQSAGAAPTEKSGTFIGTEDPNLVHSFANTAAFRVGKDIDGRLWASFAGTNKIVALDPKSGKSEIYEGPAAPQDSPMSAGMYQGVMTANGRYVWFTQLGAAQVFRFNVSKKEIDKVIKFGRGSGPRRLTISDKDILYIPMQGGGELTAYDGNTAEFVGKYTLPDRHCATYTITWDSRRQVVWAPCSNADQIYAFSPATGRFVSYLLPRRAPLIRALSVDPVNGDLVFTYAPVADLRPNNLMVVMRPTQ